MVQAGIIIEHVSIGLIQMVVYIIKSNEIWLFTLSDNYKSIPRFCVEGLPKILDFDYFVLIW